MVYVRLSQDWTDSANVPHPEGQTFPVNGSDLTALENMGIIVWRGPTGDPIDRQNAVSAND
jgi:hypothetical protein